MNSLPARNGAAARLAHLLRERGLSADIRTRDRVLVLTARNPAVPFGKMSQHVALIGSGDSDVFV